MQSKEERDYTVLDRVKQVLQKTKDNTHYSEQRSEAISSLRLIDGIEKQVRSDVDEY